MNRLTKSHHVSRLGPLLLTLIIVGAVLAVVVWTLDTDALVTALAGSGLAVVWMSIFRAVPLAMDAAAWGCILPAPQRLSLTRLVVPRWIGESINTVLPVGQVGGDFARARLMAKILHSRSVESSEQNATGHHAPGPLAAAATMTDFILGLMTQGVFALVAVAILVIAGSSSGPDADVIIGTGAVSLLAVVGVLALWRVLVGGAFSRVIAILRRAGPERAMTSLAQHSSQLESTLLLLSRAQKAVLAAFTIKLFAWFVRGVEIWIAAHALGIEMAFLAALAIEGVASAARSAAFFIPGAVGVQEGGLVAAAALFGVPLEAALAIALLKRAREVVVSLPGLIAWAVMERKLASLPAQDASTVSAVSKPER